MPEKKLYAKDYICCNCKKRQAEYFWPNVDPDIPSHPYCKICLDEAQMRVLAELQKISERANAASVWRKTMENDSKEPGEKIAL